MIGPEDFVLLLVEFAQYDETKRRRNKEKEALFEVDGEPTEEREEDLWRAMTRGGDPRTFALEAAPYRRVCIVAPEGSPARRWVSFFRRSMPALVAAGKLYVCAPPYDRRQATIVRPEEDPVS